MRRKKIPFFFELPCCKHDFCKECMVKYLKQKIDSSEVLHIFCPSQCGKEFSEEEIKTISTWGWGLYNRYQSFKKLLIWNSDPNIRWCVRERCENMIKCVGNEDKISCNKCGQEICFKCRLAWHGKISCLKVLEKEFQSYSNNAMVKLCPKCQSRIEKMSGCNHMTCSRCRHQFCWLCRGKYSANHYLWYNIFGCPKMQYQQMTTGKNRIFQFCKFLLMLVVVILAVPAVVLGACLAILGVFLAILPYLYTIYINDKKTTVPEKILLVFLALLGLVLSPIILILMICPGSCLALREYRKRKNEQ